MADIVNQTSLTNAAPPPATLGSTKKEKKSKNPRSKPSHPPTSDMVNNAIKGLKERGGSSLQAIKKYVAGNYKVDAEKVAPFIKKYLKTAVASGSLIQTKGKGASGSFKLASAQFGVSRPASGKGKSTTTVRRKKATVTVGAATTPKTTPAKARRGAGKKTPSASPKSKKVSVAKKAARPKKVIAEKAATPRTSSKAKSPLKAKKSIKTGPTKKPRAPKPKSTKSVTSKAKKAASPKRKK